MPFVRAGLVRERNKVRAVLREARRELKVSMESRVLL
jgi:3-methyladenine DNA glycosylase Tag